MGYKEVSGDLISLAKQGSFDVIAHGCNCLCVMGAGLAPQVAKAFGCDNFYLEKVVSMEKLGDIDYETFVLGENAIWNLENADNKKGEPELVVVNAYTQYSPGPNLDYEALTICLRKINNTFKGLHIGLPQIGCGIAGGDWERVKSIIQKELVDMNVTIVIYQP